MTFREYMEKIFSERPEVKREYEALRPEDLLPLDVRPVREEDYA